MINEILTASGIPYRQGRYMDPPAQTYGVYFDDITTIEGPDAMPGAPLLIRHDAMVELYEPMADPEAEAALEAELIARGVPWTKQDRYWLQNVQRYQVIYEFDYVEKRRT